MQLLSVDLRGVTTFTQPAQISFDALPDGLVALVGPNGAGKTTLLEAGPASLYKQLVTRPGSLYDWCHGSDAYIEARWATDAGVLTSRLSIDATKRTTEGYLFLDGRPITDGKAAGFDSEVLARAGSLDLFLAGPFAAQGAVRRAARPRPPGAPGRDRAGQGHGGRGRPARRPGAPRRPDARAGGAA